MAFNSLPGAVVTLGSETVEHYGSLFVEQRALAHGGVVSRGDLAILAVSGSDRLSWLDSLTSQSLGGLRAGDSAETLLLDPHGHIEQVLHIVDDGDTSWLIVPERRREAAHAWFDRMRFRADVRIRDASAERAVVAQHGDISLDLSHFGATPWRDPWPGVTAGGFAYGDRATEWRATEWLVPVDRLTECVAALRAASVPIAGTLAWEALRIAAGRPVATDADDRALPHEFDWLRTAVHLAKGCYRGQETVAKVHNLGRPPRRLVLLHLDGSDSVNVAPGDTVWATKDGELREVGVMTAAAQHWEMGPIGLALVKRAMPATEPVMVKHGEEFATAGQEVLVPSDAGPAVELPRLPRLGARS